MDNTLIFQTKPKVILGTNIFTNFQVVLKYEDTNLLEVINFEEIGFTSKIKIYNSDGIYLAKAIGNRLYKTNDGEKAGLIIDKYSTTWVCKLENKILFEIEHKNGDEFRTNAELYTPDGYFVKCSPDAPTNLVDKNGTLKFGNMIFSDTTINGNENLIAVWIKKDGSTVLGARI